MAQRSSEHRYQLPFDFTQKPEAPISVEQIVPVGSLSAFNTRPPGRGLFIRSVDDDAIIQTPTMAANFLMCEIFTPFDEFTQKEIVTLMLNTRNRIIHAALIYCGTINAGHQRTAEFLRPATLVNTRSMVPAHRHPRGDLSLGRLSA